MAETKAKIMKDGPIIIEGDCDYEDAEGNAVDTGDRRAVALCRCGSSENKPFCDGAHSRVNFQG